MGGERAREKPQTPCTSSAFLRANDFPTLQYLVRLKLERADEDVLPQLRLRLEVDANCVQVVHVPKGYGAVPHCFVGSFVRGCGWDGTGQIKAKTTVTVSIKRRPDEHNEQVRRVRNRGKDKRRSGGGARHEAHELTSSSTKQRAPSPKILLVVLACQMIANTSEPTPDLRPQDLSTALALRGVCAVHVSFSS